MGDKKHSFFGGLFGKKKKEGVQVAVKTERKKEEPLDKLEEKKEEKITASAPQVEAKIAAKTEAGSAKTETQEKQPDFSSEYEGQLAIDVYQTEDEIIIKSTIAGVKPEDIDVTIDNDMVTIKGERKHEENVSKDNYFYQECYWGAFSRSVILPCDIETDKVAAEIRNGILTVHLPKVNKSKTKKISVRAAQ